MAFSLKFSFTSAYEGCYLEERNGIYEVWNHEGPICKVNLDSKTYLPKEYQINKQSKEPQDIYLVIKDYAENQGLYQSLLKLGIIEPAIDYVITGFVSCPVCKFNKERAEELSERSPVAEESLTRSMSAFCEDDNPKFF